jgi:hypothetical protein
MSPNRAGFCFPNSWSIGCCDGPNINSGKTLVTYRKGKCLTKNYKTKSTDILTWHFVSTPNSIHVNKNQLSTQVNAASKPAIFEGWTEPLFSKLETAIQQYAKSRQNCTTNSRDFTKPSSHNS